MSGQIAEFPGYAGYTGCRIHACLQPTAKMAQMYMFSFLVDSIPWRHPTPFDAPSLKSLSSNL
jgi:hypothetical protein